ncbi:DUF255 domain-containing protein [bacterium]|nr:DUF255 domain-containing protein [bacterium]MBU1959465.1 DUF255 domain-containing protein [bacterium]
MPNNLENETSPYLLKHANNPINWYPWGEEALAKAKAENKSIFLSIGYSSCHWCQVMEKESFQDDKIAELLNERFIAIKVDKEERPDIDKYYQKVYQLMNRRSGGWPTSIFMTENLEPFYAATYISPEARREEFGFEELLRTVSKKYITEYETLVEKGSEILQHINPKNKTIEATKLNLNIMQTITLHVGHLLDKKEGGFGTAPKFPHASTLALLFDQYLLTKEKEVLNAALFSLEGMSKGGVYDHVDGGFYRYAIDEKWLVPYRVKTTYDNALLSQLYLQAYQITNNQNYKEITFKTIDFMLQQMSEDGLFFAKKDQTENETTTDKTIITSWNAMMVSALFKISSIDKKYKAIAITSLESLLDNLYINGILYHSKVLGTEPKVKAFLEDYAYLGETLITAYQTTHDEGYLIMASKFANSAIEQFYDHGQWKFSNGEFKIQDDIFDTTYPSSISTVVSLLMSISSLVDVHYKKFVFKTLEINSYALMRQPLSSPKLTQMLLRYLKDDIILGNI